MKRRLKALIIPAAGNPANEIRAAPGAEHVKSYVINRGEDIYRITAFYDAVLS